MANYLKELYTARGYSRYRFAALVGVSPVTIWRWEQEQEGLTQQTLKRCAAHLGVAATDIDPELAQPHPLLTTAPVEIPA